MWRFLYYLRHEQNHTENRIEKVVNGPILPKLMLKKYRRLNLQIRDKMQEYKSKSRLAVFWDWINEISNFVPK